MSKYCSHIADFDAMALPTAAFVNGSVLMTASEVARKAARVGILLRFSAIVTAATTHWMLVFISETGSNKTLVPIYEKFTTTEDNTIPIDRDPQFAHILRTLNVSSTPIIQSNSKIWNCL